MRAHVFLSEYEHCVSFGGVSGFNMELLVRREAVNQLDYLNLIKSSAVNNKVK